MVNVMMFKNGSDNPVGMLDEEVARDAGRTSFVFFPPQL
jgi:hypothetical protein